jgi:ABC-type multidrug transport system ATPase subunit
MAIKEFFLFLFSNSMDECEALCSRVGLLINGRLKCIGTSEHIKKRYGAGLSLTVKLKKANSVTVNHAGDRIEKFIKKRFKNAVLKGLRRLN